MRVALAVLLGWMLLVPASASALNPGECARLMKQIHHLNTMTKEALAGMSHVKLRTPPSADLHRRRNYPRCPHRARRRSRIARGLRRRSSAHSCECLG